MKAQQPDLQSNEQLLETSPSAAQYSEGAQLKKETLSAT